MPDRWKVGHGRLRVACHVDDEITALAWHQETLVIGTRAGLVRAVDVESGSVVGDYYYPHAVPSAAVTQLFFDGQAIVAGFGDGQLHVWRGELPGFWGFSHSSSWAMKYPSDGEESSSPVLSAHEGAVTGMALLDDGRLVSSGKDGSIAIWNKLAEEGDVAAKFYARVSMPVQAICAGEGSAIFIALVQEFGLGGELQRFDVETGQVEKLSMFAISPVSLAWDSEGQALLIGLQNGQLNRWQESKPNALEELKSFHAGAVSSLFVRERSHSAEPRLFFTAGGDGRVLAWDAHAAQPLWGLQGLKQPQPLVLADRSRLVTSAIEINPVATDPQTSHELFFRWQEPGSHEIPFCEALLFMDFASDPSKSKEEEEEEWFWPDPEKTERPQHRRR